MASLFSFRKTIQAVNNTTIKKSPVQEEKKNTVINLHAIPSSPQSNDSSSSSEENSNKKDMSHNFFKGLINTVNKVNIKFTRKRSAIKIKASTASVLQNLSQEQILCHGLELLKNPNRSVSDNQVVIDFLMSLEPFSQSIIEVKGDKARELMISLSFALKHNSKPANSIIFRYGEVAEKFYLILEGKVEFLVPNDSVAYLTEVEYFNYLLQLRKYNEIELLNRALLNNNEQYPMNEKNFDIWIKMAYYTIMNIRQRQKPIDTTSEGSSPSSPKRLSRYSIFTIGAKRQSKISPQRIFRLRARASNPDIKLFDTKELKDLVMELENEITSTYAAIDPMSLIPDPGKNKYVSRDDYIERIKPVYKNDQGVGAERKNVLITTYFVAQTLGPGEKFGEMMGDQQLSNEDNKRVGTVITCTDTQLGALNKMQYNDILKDVSEKNRRDQLSFLFCINIFRKGNKSLFMKNFSNFFTKKVVKYKETLYTENSPLSNNHMIYFIKEGQFETSCTKTIAEIDEILTHSSLKRKMDQSEIDKLEKYKEYYQKKEFKFQTFGANDIIGLEDCFWNNRYLFSVTCSCTKAIVFEVHITFFRMLLNLDKVVSENVKELQMIKRDILLKMLFNQRKAKILILKSKLPQKDTLRKKDHHFTLKPRAKKSQTLFAIRTQNNFYNVNKIDKKMPIIHDKNSDIRMLSVPKKHHKSKLTFDFLELTEDDRKIFQKILIRQKNSSSLLSASLNNNLSKHNLQTERTAETFEPKIKELLSKEKLKMFELDLDLDNNSSRNSSITDYRTKQGFSSLKKNVFVNPLVYDDFNRMYNTLKYYNTESFISNRSNSSSRKLKLRKNENNDYYFRLTEGNFYKGKSKVSANSASQLFKNENKNIIDVKLHSIYNKKYKKLMCILNK